MREMRGITYDWASFDLATGESDYDVSTEIAALFSNVPVARGMSILFNRNISLKINSTLMPSIVLQIGDSPFQSPLGFLEIKNIYLSNSSGSTANIKILIW